MLVNIKRGALGIRMFWTSAVQAKRLWCCWYSSQNSKWVDKTFVPWSIPKELTFLYTFRQSIALISTTSGVNRCHSLSVHRCWRVSQLERRNLTYCRRSPTISILGTWIYSYKLCKSWLLLTQPRAVLMRSIFLRVNTCNKTKPFVLSAYMGKHLKENKWSND